MKRRSLRLKFVKFYIRNDGSIDLDVNYFETTSKVLKEVMNCISNLTKAVESEPMFPNNLRYFHENFKDWIWKIRSAYNNFLMVGNLAIFLHPQEYSSSKRHLKRDVIEGFNLLELGVVSVRVVTTYDLEFAMFEEFGAVPVTLLFKFGDKVWLRYRKLLINFADLDKLLLIQHADRWTLFVFRIVNELTELNVNFQNELEEIVKRIDKELDSGEYDIAIFDVKTLYNCFLQKFEDFIDKWNEKRMKK